MPDTQLGSVGVAAEQAAGAGDYASAERLLREALKRQETDLGLAHPDLANTLNNLGVVCDMVDKVDEAEYCYRRAYTIAVSAPAPDQNSVATIRKNLEDFYAAHGRHVDLPAPRPAPKLQPERPAARPADILPERASSPVPPPVAAGRSFRPLAFGAASLCAVAVVVIVAARPWLDSEKSSRDASSKPVSAPAAPPAPSSLAEPTPPRIEPRPAPEIAVTKSDPVEVPERRAVAPSTSGALTVVSAQLCRSISTGPRDWQCDPAGPTVDRGRLLFYSRVRSPRATTVSHRWYRDDRLQQEVKLPIRANPGSGYRTYSGKTMTADSAGDWRVELRAADGSLLHEERFTVR